MKIDVWLLARICLPLALMHWNAMPFWAALILFAIMQTNVMLIQFSTFMVMWALGLSAGAEETPSEPPEFHIIRGDNGAA